MLTPPHHPALSSISTRELVLIPSPGRLSGAVKQYEKSWAIAEKISREITRWGGLGVVASMWERVRLFGAFDIEVAFVFKYSFLEDCSTRFSTVTLSMKFFFAACQHLSGGSAESEDKIIVRYRPGDTVASAGWDVSCQQELSSPGSGIFGIILPKQVGKSALSHPQYLVQYQLFPGP